MKSRSFPTLALAGVMTLFSCKAHEQEPATRAVVRQQLMVTFRDVPRSHPNSIAIQYLAAHNVMMAQPDGLFHPEQGVTRGELLHVLLDAAGNIELPTATVDPFIDVHADHPLAGYILRALQLGIVRGYEDGYFRIDRVVSLIESLKILLLTNRIGPNELHNLPSYTDVPAGVWFVPFARYAMDHHLVDARPDGSMGRDQQLNRGQISDLLWRFFRDRPDLLPDASRTPR